MVFWMCNPTNLPSTRFSLNESDWPSNAYIRSHFGQRVLWHEYDEEGESSSRKRISSSAGGSGSCGSCGRHLTVESLEPYRRQGDQTFDEILDLYDREGRPLRPGDDWLERAASVSNSDEKFNDQDPLSEADQASRDILAYYSKLPTWVDKAQLKRGQDVFLAYLPAIGMSLYYRSLVPGFSIPKIAAVLQATAYLAPPASKQAVHDRLMDTGAFLGAVLQSETLDAILPHGEGWKAALQVRVLHAKVRRQILTRKGNRQWDVDHLGIPINQEDLAATLLAFSTNSLWGVEFVLGRPLPLQDRLDYLALWRYLGWLLGVDVDDEQTSDKIQQNYSIAKREPQKLRALDPCGDGWFPSETNPVEHSHAMFQSIILHLMHPDESSVRMSHHLLRQGRRQDGDNKQSEEETIKLKKIDSNWYYFRSFQCRRFVGNDLADALELPYRPTWWGRMIQRGFSTIYFTVIALYTVAGLPFSPLRQRLIRYHRSHMAKFMGYWTESHLERMRKKLNIETENRSVCPFAMISNQNPRLE